MIHNIPFEQTTVRFEELGKGYPVVLLHGFMESLDAWGEFAEDLSKHFRVINIDLLGHGKTGNIDTIHTMEMMALAVKSVLDHLRIDKAFFIGHSMGGYVALQFLKDYPQNISGLVILHSTPLPDSDERKGQREKLIGIIKQGGKIKLAKEHVHKTFAPKNIDKYVQKIGFLKIIALNTTNEGIIAALEGMKIRPDYREVLKNAKIPVLYIQGEHDNFIPPETMEKFELPQRSSVLILKNSGHQGYIEEKDKVLEAVVKFINSNVAEK